MFAVDIGGTLEWRELGISGGSGHVSGVLYAVAQKYLGTHYRLNLHHISDKLFFFMRCHP